VYSYKPYQRLHSGADAFEMVCVRSGKCSVMAYRGAREGQPLEGRLRPTKFKLDTDRWNFRRQIRLLGVLRVA